MSSANVSKSILVFQKGSVDKVTGINYISRINKLNNKRKVDAALHPGLLPKKKRPKGREPTVYFLESKIIDPKSGFRTEDRAFVVKAVKEWKER